ncbi:MAG: hypothetical protein C6Y22_20320 [Hapalosiphonaceae cyanobacterium JJU2]|nr:MAG: hypothetical protein C6Y22_20320 [Hapalosiphonaceae cyanobacterium JJU2]
MEVKRYQNLRLWRSEVLLAVTLSLGILHHIDHILRADRSGWPFISDVTPFTFSLLVYPLFLSVFLTRSYPWYRVVAITFAYIATQMGHIFIETPVDQYSTWAYGISNVSHSLGKPNLLGIASPAMGIYAVVLSLLLSVAFIVTLFELIRDARLGTSK